MLEQRLRTMLERIQNDPLRGAWRATAGVTVTVTLGGGLLMRLTDPEEFPTVWRGLWWSAQTVTTVGYGDTLPTSTAGRLVAVLVMMLGVTFITVTSAAIASMFVEAARRRRAASEDVGSSADIAALAEEVRALSAEVRRLGDQLAPPAPEPGDRRPG